MPFVLTGFIFKKYEKQIMHLNARILCLLGVSYVALTLCNSDVDLSINHLGLNYTYTYVNAVLTSILMFNIVGRLRKCKIAEVYSNGTFLILGVHIIIRNLCHTIFLSLHIPEYSLCYSIVIMLSCYLPIVMAIKYCPILLGKIKKH